MTKPAPAQRPAIVDPRDEPVRVINQVTFHGVRGSLLDVTLFTVTAKPAGDRFVDEAVVTARLRFDVGMARALLQGLAQQIAMVDAARSPVN